MMASGWCLDNAEEMPAVSSLESRSVRAIREYMTVLQDAPDLYLVVSQSGREYMVDTEEPACTCPDFQYREVECKHIRRVRLETGGVDPEPLGTSLETAATELETHADGLVKEADTARWKARRLRRIRTRLSEIVDRAEEEL